MDEFVGMKGAGQNIMSLFGPDGSIVRLLSYSDGSWSVVRDGSVCGIWEADDIDDCLRAFILQSGRTPQSIAVIFRSVTHDSHEPIASLN